MKAGRSDWYKDCWTLDIKNASWVEKTESQVDFIISKLNLKGGERILDLACGYGRHSLEFARRGFKVTGVDITPAFIEDAKINAKEQKLSADFFCGDVREVAFRNEFDLVLNMADGAIGYLENDAENEKIFDVAARALKNGGYHFVDIGNADYADSHFPQKLWDAGTSALTVSNFEWNSETRILLYGQIDIPYGSVLEKPVFEYGDPTRLYSVKELESLYKKHCMTLTASYTDFTDKRASEKDYQMEVVAQKAC